MLTPRMRTLTIITTDKCNASCSECCFQCNPQKNRVLNFKDIKDFVDEGYKTFPELETVVFSGGECTLLKEDLFESLEYCSKLGLATRIVTNGFWGNTKKSALKMALRLKDAGLNEINFSTGDNHQQWVPYDSVVNSVIECTKLNIRVAVSIESHNASKFNRNEAMNHKDIIKILNSDFEVKPSFFESVWIPFHNKSVLTYENFNLDTSINGCENILEFLGLFPDKSIKACCGLTIDYIDEMTLGMLNKDKLEDIFFKQLKDFLKIWLWVDGPEYIYKFAIDKIEGWKENSRFIHPCQFCAEIYNNNTIMNVLASHWEEKIDEVMFRFNLKIKEQENLAEGSVINGVY